MKELYLNYQLCDLNQSNSFETNVYKLWNREYQAGKDNIGEFVRIKR